MELSLERIKSARAVLIAGPTASGKSALALQLAKDAGQAGRPAWIVNADAMQVYDALRILTARPSPIEEEQVPHRLYGHVPAETRYSVGAWLADMEAVLQEAEDAGALVVAVGGTGLYFKALTEGIAEVPPVPADVRRRIAERLEAEGVATLHAELAERDPVSAAAVRPSDPQRVIRALEVLETTGSGLSTWQARSAKPPLLVPDVAVRMVVDIPRAHLRARIEARVDRMVEEGALEEVCGVLARGLDPDLPVMKALGVRPFAASLRGEITLDDAIADAKTETRRYAKRQSTWFRNQMREWLRRGS